MFRGIFRIVDPFLIRFYRRISEPPAPNLRGERDVEYSWVASNIPNGPGTALDFGCGTSWMGFLAARKGFKVTAIDLRPVGHFYKHPALNVIQGDVHKMKFCQESYDLIFNCSSIEHVGLSGRFGVTEQNDDGDLQAMTTLGKLLKAQKLMLLTVPVGRDRVFRPMHRVYGRERLPKLLDGWEVLKKEYWAKDDANRWVHVDESFALDREPTLHCYGLGLFMLRRPGGMKPHAN